MLLFRGITPRSRGSVVNEPVCYNLERCSFSGVVYKLFDY
jgi:hypothetical protein